MTGTEEVVSVFVRVCARLCDSPLVLIAFEGAMVEGVVGADAVAVPATAAS